jgi:hypothetical protein
MRTILIMVLAAVSSCFALRADINGDGRVDLLDLMIMAEEWLMEDEMDFPEKLEVTGDLNPDVTGIFKLTGQDALGNPIWTTDQTSIFILFDTNYSEWRLMKFGMPVTYYWRKPNTSLSDGPLGEYEPFNATGTATVKKARQPNASGTLTAPGRGKRIRARVRGVYAAIRLSNTNKDESFSFERVVCNVEPRGRVK